MKNLISPLHMGVASTTHMNLGIDISVAFCYIGHTLDSSIQHTHGSDMAYRGTRQGRATPRIRHAARLYASGAVKTKQEAAEAVGVNPSYFNIVTQPGHARSNPEIIKLMDEIEEAIHDKTVSLSSVIEQVSREAVSEMRELMRESNNEAIRLKAASDILDRNPETSKTQKHQLSSFSLGSEDAKALAAALVKSAEATRLYGQAAVGDFVKIPQEPEDAGSRLLTPEVRQVDEGVAERAVERILESAEAIVNGSAGPSSEGSAPDHAAASQPEVLRLVPRASEEVIRSRVRALNDRSPYATQEGVVQEDHLQ